jgi:glycosyltransferase involved in cell wall biosynthesis
MLEWLKQWGQQRGWWDREDGFLLTSSRAIVTTNIKAETEIRTRLPQFQDRVVQIPIAMNVEAIPIDRGTARQQLRQQFDWAEDAKVITFFGFLHPVKGLETLLPAFQQVSILHPQAHLLLIGGVESLALHGEAAQHYWQQLQTQIANLNLTDRVHVTGYISAAEVFRFLAGADIGVLPLNHGVTLKSGSLLNLFAHQLPVIATRHEQIDADLADDRLILAIPPRQVAALAQAIQTLLQNPACCDRLATAGYEFVTSFNWATIAEKHLAIYSDRELHPLE